jgi:hypothetical protein
MGIKTDFLRNTLCEMLPPVNKLGNSFIIIPFYYLDRIYTDAVSNERGDLIRFVATENGTIVKQAVYNTTTKIIDMITVTTSMRAGEFCDNVNSLETPAYYISNKPVLVGQYGKSWIDYLPMPKIFENDSTIMDNTRTDLLGLVRSGMGSLLCNIPIERWCSKTVIKVPEAMSTFMYMYFLYEDINKVLINGNSIANIYGNAINTIQGTPYGFLRAQVSANVITLRALMEPSSL